MKALKFDSYHENIHQQSTLIVAKIPIILKNLLYVRKLVL